MREHSGAGTRRSLGGGLLAVSLLLLPVPALPAEAGTAGQGPAREVRVLARQALPGAPDPARDVRWASDTSVYVAYGISGVREVALDGKSTRRRRLVPHREEIGGFHDFTTLAVSGGTLAVAAVSKHLAWTRIQPEPGGERIFRRAPDARLTMDLDLFQGRMLLLGIPFLAGEFAPHGKVAWVGPLDGKIADFRPVLSDPAGADVPHLSGCASLNLGAVRFLGDGSFVVAPGFQPGVHLFNPQGVLVRSWDDAALGLSDARCAEVSDQKRRWLALHPDGRLARFNTLRTVDDVVPLPQGPGVLVRAVEDGQVRWQLKLLRPDGKVVTYAVPFTSTRLTDRLRADARGGRMILLRYPHHRFSIDREPPAELIVAELPPA